ncbi:hypothetical protein A7982_12808 [Minicystis rosea]|nr:hypothetical protein A7982_12808 [Minicystis rosea]
MIAIEVEIGSGTVGATAIDAMEIGATAVATGAAARREPIGCSSKSPA